jgi:AhpD family alkylhydroperoxidase
MATVKLIEYEDANDTVKAVFDDIRATRQTDYINNFWKALANHPDTLQRTWATAKQVMAAGSIDAMTKEMIYIAVSITNSCDYCIHTHTAAAINKGMTDSQYQELLAVIALAHQTNSIATGLKMPVDEVFLR